MPPPPLHSCSSSHNRCQVSRKYHTANPQAIPVHYIDVPCMLPTACKYLCSTHACLINLQYKKGMSTHTTSVDSVAYMYHVTRNQTQTRSTDSIYQGLRLTYATRSRNETTTVRGLIPSQTSIECGSLSKRWHIVQLSMLQSLIDYSRNEQNI